MTEHTEETSCDALAELVTQLLECGAVLSQIIGHMIRAEAAGRSAPDAAPIPEVAHELISGVLADVRKSYSSRDLKTAAAIIQKATYAIGEDIFLVPLDCPQDDSGINGHASGASE
ncbi:MAG: hypothetical protein JO179_10115 [Solirubrobacterales bacterium]|nr:hypothetical protein [Solirubrobacterales bacterium]